MTYTDAYLLPIPNDKFDEYRAIASMAGPVWIEHGALSYKEFVIDDDNIDQMISFSKLAGVQENETCIIAFATYKSREHRDEVMAKVMTDQRLKDACDQDKMPFEFTRMAYGGFSSIVDL